MSHDTRHDAFPQVLTEIQSGDGLSLSAAGRTFPAHRGSGTINPSTVFRWVTKGTRIANGQVVSWKPSARPDGGLRRGQPWLGLLQH